MLTRDEHLEWCKRRAREYLDRNNVRNAIASMMSDLRKHPETEKNNDFIMAMGFNVASSGDRREAQRWIEGFR